MIKKYTNKTLHEVVLKVFSTLGISEFHATERKEIKRIKDGISISVRIGAPDFEYEDYKEFRYVIIGVVFNIIKDDTAKKGYVTTPETEGFTLWGYLKNDFSDYMPDDFTHYAPGLNNGQGWDNFFRDHLDIPEAKVSIARFKERVETL
jgi:hypothetical protein